MVRNHSGFGRLRATNRARWFKKFRLVKRHVGSWKSITQSLPFILLSPEVHTFSSEVLIDERYLSQLAPIFKDRDHLLGAIQLSESSLSEVAEDFPQLTRFHPEIHRRPPLGRYTSVCILIAQFRPTHVVEIGVHHGAGTLAIHKTLQKIHRDSDFSLLSIDINPRNGWLPRRANLDRWRLEVGDAETIVRSLEPIPAGVVLAVLDATPDSCSTRAQIEGCLEFAAGWPCILIGNANWNDEVASAGARFGMWTARIEERASGHWPPGRSLDVVFFNFP